MRQFILLAYIFFLGVLQTHAQNPEVVHSIIKESRPHSFFVEQAKLWWGEVEKNEKNEKAWYYYYKANRYAQMTFSGCKTPECKKINTWIEESPYLKTAEEIRMLISKSIPNTYTYYIVIREGYPGDKERLEVLQKAYELEPDNPDTYDELVVYFETNNEPDKRLEFNKKWYRSNDLPSGILNYNYNVLLSMKKGGAILTFGDNDTFPLWMLQDAKNIRTDITVLNVPLLTNSDYRETIFEKLNIPELSKTYENGAASENQQEIVDHIIKNKPSNIPLYISTPAWKQLKEYEDNLFILGLVMEYSKENIDNIALLKNNFENNYSLDYLDIQFSFDISQGVINKMNVNYLPGLIKLYQHYLLSGDLEKANKAKELGLLIADKGGNEWKKKAIEIFD